MLSNNLICAPTHPSPPPPPPFLSFYFHPLPCFSNSEHLKLKAKADTQGLCYQGVWLRDELPHCK